MRTFSYFLLGCILRIWKGLNHETRLNTHHRIWYAPITFNFRNVHLTPYEIQLISRWNQNCAVNLTSKLVHCKSVNELCYLWCWFSDSFCIANVLFQILPFTNIFWIVRQNWTLKKKENNRSFVNSLVFFLLIMLLQNSKGVMAMRRWRWRYVIIDNSK